MRQDGLVPAPREQGWLRLLLALAAFMLLPRVMPFRVLLPVEHATLLLAPALAACFIVGWWAGGRLSLALLWAATSAVVLYWAGATLGIADAAYLDIARAWALLAAGAFGVVCVFGASRPFTTRALSSIGLALLFGTLILFAGDVALDRAQDVFAEQYGARHREWELHVEPNAPTGSAAGVLFALRRTIYERLSVVGGTLFPAFLALQTLAAVALAWALYHRLARARIGPPLTPLRWFRFSELLIWGPALGLTLALLPTLAALRPVGENLLVFFGALYLLRGLGIVAWLFSAASTATIILAGIAAVAIPPLAPSFALGLGITDTWVDWRGRLGATPSSSPPLGVHHGSHSSPVDRESR